MFAARLRAYAPGGAALGLLPDPLSWQASVVHGDLGALSVTYSTLTAGGPLVERPLADGLEVAVEVWDGATWVEPRGCRFVRVAQGSDTADDMQVYTLTFRAYGWLLTQAPLIGGTFTDGRRYFVAPKAGSLVGTVLAENAADGGVPVTVIGGGTTDAGGASWPTLPDQNFEYGADGLGIVRGLQEAGALDWATQARGLYLYLPDSAALSPDLSGTVRLRLGRDIGQAPADETIETLVSGVAVRAQAGGTVIVDEPTAPVPWGKWRRLLSIGQVDNQAAAEAMGQAELERTGRAREQYTRDLILHDGAPIPLVDYWPGSWVTAPTNVQAESVRVQQVTLTFGDGGYGGNVVLNDRLVEGDIRRARTLATLAGGQVGAGGAPAPIAVDPEVSRVPSTPTGLDVVAGITFTGPTPRGVVTATWNPVSTATDSGALTISGYELQYRIGTGAWQTIVTPEVSAIIADLTPADAITARVRAVGARTTLPSAWSATDSVTVPGDTTAPPVPTGLSISTARGIVTATWDGTPAMPADFDRIEIAIDGTATPTTVVGTLRKAGELPHPDTIGATRRARARSVDTTGNASAWSAVAGPVTVASVVSGDIDAAITTALTTAGNNANTALVQSNMIILGGPNLLLNNDFSQPGSSLNNIVGWTRSNAPTVEPATVTGPDGVVTTVLRYTSTNSDQGLANDAWKLLAAGTLVEHGKSFRFVMRARKVSGTVGSLRMRAGLYRPGSTNSWPVVTEALDAATAVAGEWVTLTGTLLIPDTYDKLSVSIHTANASGSVFEIADAFMYSMADAELVVDGSITARALAADSVSAAAIQAGSITGDLLAGELVVGNRFTTSDTGGQRVEFDPNGMRLYNADDEIRVNLPTDATEDAYFRGEVQADGLTVTGGASFRSTQNEFAPDSLIALAASVTAPVAAPNVSTFWSSVQLATPVVTGGRGTFALDPSLVQSAVWNPSANVVHLVQKVPSGGTRVWYYTIAGAYSTHWDLPASWDVSSLALGSDGEFRIMYRFSNRWWIYDYSRPEGSRDREYVPLNAARRPLLTMDGTDVYVAEVDDVVKIRRVTTDTNPVTIAGTTTTTGAPTPPSQEIAFLYRGSADFDGAKFVVSHRNALGFRHFAAAAYQATWGFDAPTSKVGAFWHPGLARFCTVGADGKIYTHSSLIWTDPALDTWHLGQTFRDSVGTVRETAIGAIRSFAPKKRAWSRVLLATVPYAGGPEDPNQWRLYGKTGTAPGAGGTGMTLQSTGAYTTTQTDMGTLLTTSGSAPPTTSNFPAANPARMQSAARLPSDSTKAVIDLRGDGFARVGPIEVDGATGKFAPSYDTGWVNVSLAPGITNVSGPYTLQVRRLGFVVHIRGQITGLAADVDTQITNTAMAAEFRPIVTVQLGLIPTGGNLNTQYARVQIQETGHIRVRSLTSTNAYLFGSWTND